MSTSPNILVQHFNANDVDIMVFEPCVLIPLAAALGGWKKTHGPSEQFENFPPGEMGLCEESSSPRKLYQLRLNCWQIFKVGRLLLKSVTKFSNLFHEWSDIILIGM